MISLLFVILISNQTLANTQPIVVTTASMIADMAENIGGDMIRIQSIVPIGGDPHIYEPTPEDARKVEKADLILMNGLTFEGWLKELVDHSGTNAPSVIVTQGIVPIESVKYKNATDPHAWMDPVNGLTYIQNIYQALLTLMPDKKEELTFNYQTYKDHLEQLHQYCQQRMNEIPQSQRILITSHDAFQYYGRRYGIHLEAILGTSTDSDVQTSDILRIEKVLSTHPVPAVFIESTINPKLLQQIADDNGVVIGGQLYSDSLSDQEGPANTYEKMIKHNTDVIVDALSKPRTTSAPEKNKSGYLWIFGLTLITLALLLFILWKKK